MLLHCHKPGSSLLLGTAIGVAVFQRICFCRMVPSVCDLTQLVMNQVSTTDLCTCFVTVHELSMLYHTVLGYRRKAKLRVKTILSAFFFVKFQKPMLHQKPPSFYTKSPHGCIVCWCCISLWPKQHCTFSGVCSLCIYRKESNASQSSICKVEQDNLV